MPLINMLAYEAWHIQAIHHEQEIDKLSVEGKSKGISALIWHQRKQVLHTLFNTLFSAVSLFE